MASLKKRRPTVDKELNRVEFMKNYNNEGDSDYDDENDSVVLDDSHSESDLSKVASKQN